MPGTFVSATGGTFNPLLSIAESSFHNWANANGIERIKDGHNTYVDADIVDEKAARGEIGKYVHQKKKRSHKL